jgi:hypothetical protein
MQRRVASIILKVFADDAFASEIKSSIATALPLSIKNQC